MKTSASRPATSVQHVSHQESQRPGAAGEEKDYHAGVPLELGDGPQLLIDDALVEDRWRLRREFLPPEKYIRNPLIARDQPWEGGLFPYFSVFFDESTKKF